MHHMSDEDIDQIMNAKKGEAFTHRLGKLVKVDEVNRAWKSGDLNRMLKAINLKTHLLDRHLILMAIVRETYKKREKPDHRKLCKKVAVLHINEFKTIAPALRYDLNGVLPRVSTFQHLATLLTEDKRFQDAVRVCQIALKYELKDGTMSGFQGRINPILKKQQKFEQTGSH
ncbi:MAG: hypothetical protein COA78_11235 [Blastopirellula sp.]|nr:MAG: hypothetical protein COA78_11235 [Blastopirellula sp.]